MYAVSKIAIIAIILPIIDSALPIRPDSSSHPSISEMAFAGERRSLVKNSRTSGDSDIMITTIAAMLPADVRINETEVDKTLMLSPSIPPITGMVCAAANFTPLTEILSDAADIDV